MTFFPRRFRALRFWAAAVLMAAGCAAFPAAPAYAQSDAIFEIKREDGALPPLDEYNDVPKGLMLSAEEQDQVREETPDDAESGKKPVKIEFSYEEALRKYKAGEIPEIISSLQLLADAEHRGAEELLGIIYRMGQGGVQKDPEKAFKLLSNAAEADRPLAQHHLGIMYYLGEGRPRDSVQALAWMNIAIILYPDGPEKQQAERDRETIMANMSRRDRENAQLQARDWLSKRGMAHLLDLR